MISVGDVAKPLAISALTQSMLYDILESKLSTVHCTGSPEIITGAEPA